jgi:hypothetical protein
VCSTADALDTLLLLLGVIGGLGSGGKQQLSHNHQIPLQLGPVAALAAGQVLCMQGGEGKEGSTAALLVQTALP